MKVGQECEPCKDGVLNVPLVLGVLCGGLILTAKRAPYFFTQEDIHTGHVRATIGYQPRQILYSPTKVSPSSPTTCMASCILTAAHEW
eukprot:COSAG01_NODE_10938_length_2043_cov_3.886831_4_plen_88_part_00